MALDPAFVADCPYLADGIFIDEILTIDRERSRVIARMPTHAELPITRTQRVHPVKHPRHVSGGLMVHVTGVVGFAHAFYVLDLRHADGWTGYGARINNARYRALATVDAPLEIECQALHVRRGAERVMVKYAFEFRQNDRAVYSSEQTAMFVLANG
jgi:hypothetical protein